MPRRLTLRRARCFLLAFGLFWLLPACGSAFSSAEGDGGGDGASKGDASTSDAASSDGTSSDGTTSSDGMGPPDGGSSGDTGKADSRPAEFKCGPHECSVDSDFCLDMLGMTDPYSCNMFSSTCLSSGDLCRCAALSEGAMSVDLSCVGKDMMGKCTVQCSSFVTVGDASMPPPDAASGGM